MPSRKAAVVREGGGGVSPRQFCCACICLLGSVLLVQLCVLASLVRRLADLHRPAVPELELPAAAASSPSPPPGFLQQSGGSAAGAGAQRDLALGAAIGLGVDAVLVFLASLLRASSQCHVVLLTDQPPSRDILEAEGIDVQRVTFEIASGTSLEKPWSDLSVSSSRFKLFKDYLERTRAAEAYRFLQLSDVDDVAFQSDPFDWVSRQSPGLHAFSDVPGRTVGSSEITSIGDCYGSEASSRLSAEPFLPVGYVIGASSAVERYVQAIVGELASHAQCPSKNADEAVHNVVLRGVASSAILPLDVLRVSDADSGPVWTGGHVQKAAVRIDQSDFVTNEAGQRYAVLHQYTEHEDLWRSLNERFLKGKRQKLVALDCSSFDISSGDMKGFDLSHQPADTNTACCAACLGDPSCSAFVFSASRKHCWLKRYGGERTEPAQGNDVECGLRKR